MIHFQNLYIIVRLLFDYCSVFWSWQCIPGVSNSLSTTIYEPMNILQVQNLPTFIVAQGFQKPIATIDINWDLRLWDWGRQDSTSSICCLMVLLRMVHWALQFFILYARLVIQIITSIKFGKTATVQASQELPLACILNNGSVNSCYGGGIVSFWKQLYLAALILCPSNMYIVNFCTYVGHTWVVKRRGRTGWTRLMHILVFTKPY